MKSWLIGKKTKNKKPWLWERLREWAEGGNRGWEGWMVLPTQKDMSLSKLQETVKDREAWRPAVHGVAKSWTQLSNWMITIIVTLDLELFLPFWKQKFLLLWHIDLVEGLDCSPLGSSVHGILQAILLEWLPCPPPGDLPNPRIEPRSPTLQADSLPTELSGKPYMYYIYTHTHTHTHNIHVLYIYVLYNVYMYYIMYNIYTYICIIYHYI